MTTTRHRTRTTYRLVLPWPSPPLTANQRLSWPVRHRLTREVRTTVAWMARAARIPRTAPHVTVGLVYAPGDHRRRDADNLTPTLKAACDALVDAEIVPDDTPQWMTKLMPVIEPPTGERGLWLTVEVHPERKGQQP